MIPIDTSLVMFHNNHAGWHNKANNVRGYRIDERLDEIGELIKGPLKKVSALTVGAGMRIITCLLIQVVGLLV